MPITTSGTHSHTIQATSGCDSTGFIDVTIRNIAHSYDTTNNSNLQFYYLIIY